MIIFKTIVVTLFGQNKSDVTNIFIFSVNCYLDEELRQKIGGEKFDSMWYRFQNTGTRSSTKWNINILVCVQPMTIAIWGSEITESCKLSRIAVHWVDIFWQNKMQLKLIIWKNILLLDVKKFKNIAKNYIMARQQRKKLGIDASVIVLSKYMHPFIRIRDK